MSKPRQSAQISRIATLLFAFLVASCALSGPYEQYDEPPAPRQEVAAPRAGYIWVAGHWAREGTKWSWMDGHYEAIRANAEYVAGRWERDGDYYVWVEGGWRTLSADRR